MEKSAFMSACSRGGAAIESALRQLDRSFFVPLHRETVRAVRDHDLAKDLVQETLIKVWRNCATFRGDSELMPWIRTILRRTVLDQLRKRERVSTVDDAQLEMAMNAAAFEDNDVDTAPECDTLEAERQAAFERGWQAFQENAPGHAAVLAWVVDDGLSNQEIAELLGRTPGATREYISQCRKHARKHLQEWYSLLVSEVVH